MQGLQGLGYVLDEAITPVVVFNKHIHPDVLCTAHIMVWSDTPPPRREFSVRLWRSRLPSYYGESSDYQAIYMTPEAFMAQRHGINAYEQHQRTWEYVTEAELRQQLALINRWLVDEVIPWLEHPMSRTAFPLSILA